MMSLQIGNFNSREDNFSSSKQNLEYLSPIDYISTYNIGWMHSFGIGLHDIWFVPYALSMRDA